MSDRLKPGFGDLNPVEQQKTGRLLDPRSTEFINILQQVAKDKFKKDAFVYSGPLRGIVLRIDESSTPDPSSWTFAIFQKENVPVLKSLKVRIPEIHAALPDPAQYGPDAGQAHKIIDLYPSFLAGTREISQEPVSPGDIVLVDFGNRENFTSPIYLGPVFKMSLPGSVGLSKTGDNFDNTNKTLGVQPNNGDQIGGTKDINNQIPNPVDTSAKDKPIENMGSFQPQIDHVNSQTGLPPMSQFEDAYKNGKKIGVVELYEIPPPLSTKEGVFIAKAQKDNFVALVNAAKIAGVDLKLNSGFRSFSQQQYLYEGYKQKKPGFNLAAKPGFSNHQNGIAFDLAVGGPQTRIYKWLALNAHKFGFYNAGAYFSQRESWHFEYLGAENPVIIAEGQKTLEEKLRSFV